jgi:hypothetical protein
MPGVSYGSVENVRLVFACSSLVSPCITSLPLMVYFELLGDWFSALMTAVFWLAPIYIGLTASSKTIR